MNHNSKLTGPIATYVDAVNQQNTEEFLSAFSERAIVRDEGLEYRGIPAIKDWNAEKQFGAKITLRAVDITEQDGKTILTAEVDGSFDKTGLPDPLFMDLCFTLDGSLISGLEFRLTEN
jgi:hypothetical protein